MWDQCHISSRHVQFLRCNFRGFLPFRLPTPSVPMLPIQRQQQGIIKEPRRYLISLHPRFCCGEFGSLGFLPSPTPSLTEGAPGQPASLSHAAWSGAVCVRWEGGGGGIPGRLHQAFCAFSTPLSLWVIRCVPWWQQVSKGCFGGPCAYPSPCAALWRVAPRLWTLISKLADH